MRSVTLRQIAEAAGVSHATVSRALRGAPKVSLGEVERIRSIAEKLGYRANPLLSAWMADRRRSSPSSVSQTLAYIIGTKDMAHWKRTPAHTFVRGARQHAEKHGFKLEEFWLHEPGMTARRLSQILAARGITGVFVGSQPSSRAHLNLDWRAFCAVAQGFSLARPRLSRVANDYSQGMALALRELRKLGYRRIGLALSPVVDARVGRLWNGTFLAYQTYFDSRQRLPIHFWAADREDLFLKWVKKCRPDVIVTSHDEAERILENHGWRIPQDVGLVALGWGPHIQHWSGVDQRIEEAGRAAADLLIGMLLMNQRGIPSEPQTLLTQNAWHSGKTTKKQGKPAVWPHQPNTSFSII
jgi:LacI family transcriptional regulator